MIYDAIGGEDDGVGLDELGWRGSGVERVMYTNLIIPRESSGLERRSIRIRRRRFNVGKVRRSML